MISWPTASFCSQKEIAQLAVFPHVQHSEAVDDVAREVIDGQPLKRWQRRVLT